MKTKLLKKLRKRFYWFYDGDRWICYDRIKNIEKRFGHYESVNTIFEYTMKESKFQKYFIHNYGRIIKRKKLFLKRKYAKHFK